MPFIAIALLIAAAIGGGASVAAQNALPGDALWGFKVGVNEGLQAAFAAEGKAQANFDIAALEARMKEAAKLSANARLDADAQADIEANFDGHVKSVQNQIKKLEEKGDYAAAADVAARFQAAVAGQASALAEARGTVEVGAQGAISGLINKVQATLDTASDISAQVSAKAAAEANADADANAGSGTNAGTNTNVNAGVNADVNTNGGVQVGI